MLARNGPDIADRINVELARQRKDRKWLAHQTGLSMSTLAKLLSGNREFSQAALIRIEQALRIALAGSEPFAPVQHEPPAIAPDELGAYTRSSSRWIAQDYMSIRPLRDQRGSLLVYRTAISWDEQRGHLVFCEDRRPPGWLSHGGDVSLPSQSGHIYLLTRAEGQFRLAILARRAAGVLAGEQLTLVQGEAGQLAPASFPLVLKPMDEAERDATSAAYGIIPPENPAHAILSRELPAPR